MIFGLYAFLIGICITLILVGIFRPKESGFALIGFGLFFILSLIILNGNLEVETGANVTSGYNYDGDGNIISSDQTIDYSYDNWDNSTSHQVGFWMCIFSAFGFIGMLFAIKGGFNKDEEQ